MQAILIIALAAQAQTPPCLIQPNQVGPIQLGMTIAQAKAALPKHKVEASSDGDGAKLYSVQRGETSVMDLYISDDEDTRKPIRIEAIRVYDPACATTTGIRTGSSIADTAKAFGPFLDIQRSEIEAREFARFAKLPKWLTLQFDGPQGSAGNYPKDQSKTTKTLPGASIQSIWVTPARP